MVSHWTLRNDSARKALAAPPCREGRDGSPLRRIRTPPTTVESGKKINTLRDKSQAQPSELYSLLRFHALLAEGMLHQRHLSHQISHFDERVRRVAAGHDDMGHFGLGF